MRHIWCVHYRLCLDRRVKKELKHNEDVRRRRRPKTEYVWDCANCKRYEPAGPSLTPLDLLGCWLLLAAIFRPDDFRLYRASQHEDEEIIYDLDAWDGL